ncbi:uncharacterized protein YdeI (YjbR/CyaY-like superfamily) [Sphingomonas vulcanisoli]|uniref:Uncharacterized protein YdeI (YjbR/CyaY-like superfamily) n=1 Tax=Sphingomonas vulcanisoli TaxID=1658060 RepID=A0ABX0TM34_9SPHN|nr:YdeI/OmpD-associated family protein [Sphingomonas vulcanisoli]NIJ06579.1 uncharacterized protein YdeI (YjbR/CyaY-like superfamily) [Sphingomonas vulcanisoli]
MPQDQRIDAFIAKAQPFAQPILRQVRKAMHAALPDVEEAIKWGMPFFLIGGRPFANMAAFKAHAAFGFWKGPRTGKEADAMGQYGRLTKVEDLPPEPEFIALIRAQAASAASALPKPKAPPKPALETPDDLAEALASDAEACAVFHGFPPGCRREYIEWIVQAKRPETRASRIAKAVAQMAEGKKLNWKYENC